MCEIHVIRLGTQGREEHPVLDGRDVCFVLRRGEVLVLEPVGDDEFPAGLEEREGVGEEEAFVGEVGHRLGDPDCVECCFEVVVVVVGVIFSPTCARSEKVAHFLGIELEEADGPPIRS